MVGLARPSELNRRLGAACIASPHVAIAFAPTNHEAVLRRDP